MRIRIISTFEGTDYGIKIGDVFDVVSEIEIGDNLFYFVRVNGGIHPMIDTQCTVLDDDTEKFTLDEDTRLQY